MTDRERARRILTQCRDVLVQRLVERVVESDSDLLDDARGESYSAEIEAVQEQIGSRLQTVNQLLGALPLDEPSVYTTDSAYDTMPMPEAVPMMPPPEPEGLADEPASIQAFVRFILSDDMDEAGSLLELLLGLTRERGRQSAEFFAHQLRTQPGFLSRAMGLRTELSSGASHGAIQLLHDCFGLDGLESAIAWRRLTEQQKVPE